MCTHEISAKYMQNYKLEITRKIRIKFPTLRTVNGTAPKHCP